jgi:hypothetical protein
MNGLIDRMRRGDVQALFIHMAPIRSSSCQPVLGFEAGFIECSSVVSFSSFPDETSMEASYILPDHSALNPGAAKKPSS